MLVRFAPFVRFLVGGRHAVVVMCPHRIRLGLKLLHDFVPFLHDLVDLQLHLRPSGGNGGFLLFAALFTELLHIVSVLQLLLPQAPILQQFKARETRHMPVDSKRR